MFGNILNYILGLGAAIFLPIIMIIIGLIIKMKFKRAIVSGLTLGVAFTGMNVVLGFMFDTISPVASAFVEKTGIQLNIIVSYVCDCVGLALCVIHVPFTNRN